MAVSRRATLGVPALATSAVLPLTHSASAADAIVHQWLGPRGTGPEQWRAGVG